SPRYFLARDWNKTAFDSDAADLARRTHYGRIDPHSATEYTQGILNLLVEAYRQSGPGPVTRPYIQYLRDNDAHRERAATLFAHALRLGPYSKIKLLRDQGAVATLL